MASSSEDSYKNLNSHSNSSECPESDHDENFQPSQQFSQIPSDSSDYQTHLNEKFNVYYLLLRNIFEKIHTGGQITTLFEFFKISQEIKENLITKCKTSFYLRIAIQHLNCGNPIECNILDLIIFTLIYRKNINFVNILKHLRKIFKELNDDKHDKIEILYQKETEKIRIFTEKNLIMISNIKKKNIVAKLRSILLNLIDLSIICPVYFIDNKTVGFEKIMKLKKIYSRKYPLEKTNTFIEPDKYIEMVETKQPQTYYLDIDGIWAMFPLNQIQTINASFNINFKIRKTAFSPIMKNAIVIHKKDPVHLWSILNFKLGTFLADPNFPLHLYGITNFSIHTISETKIHTISLSIYEAINECISELKSSNSHFKYLMLDSSLNENSFNYLKNSNNKKEEQNKTPMQSIKHRIGKSLTHNFFNILIKNKKFSQYVKNFHIESFGNKAWSSTSNVLSLHDTLEQVIDTEKIDFIRCDFAVSAAISSSELQNQKNGLYIQTDFYKNLSLRENTIFSSECMSNVNQKLTKIENKKIALDPEGIDKINIYTSLIPEIFPRKIRDLRACQFTGIILYSAMCRAQEDESRKDPIIIKELKKSTIKLQSSTSKDHSFRIEIMTNLFASTVKIQKAVYCMKKGKSYIYNTEEIYKFLDMLCQNLISIYAKNCFELKDYFRLIVIELLLMELYIKGTTNTQIIFTKEIDELFSRLVNPHNIPLHNFQKIVEKVQQIYDHHKIPSTLAKSVQYSKYIPQSKMQETYYFINVLFDKDLKKIANFIRSEYNKFLSDIPVSRQSQSILDTTLAIFCNNLVKLQEFNIFPKKSQAKYTLQYFNKYRKNEIESLIKTLQISYQNTLFNNPIDKMKESNKYQRYRIVESVTYNQSFSSKSKMSFDDLKADISQKSYATTNIATWSEYDVHRLNAAINYYKNKSNADYVRALEDDIRFCFFGSIPIDKIRNKIKMLQRKQKEFNNKTQRLDFLGDTFLQYKPDKIGLRTIFEIYAQRYGVEMTDEMKRKAKDKYISFNDHQDTLIDVSIFSECQKEFISFFKNTSDQPSILSTRANDMDRIAQEMLSKTWQKNKRAKATINIAKRKKISQSNSYDKNSYSEQPISSDINNHFEDDVADFQYNDEIDTHSFELHDDQSVNKKPHTTQILKMNKKEFQNPIEEYNHQVNLGNTTFVSSIPYNLKAVLKNLFQRKMIYSQEPSGIYKICPSFSSPPTLSANSVDQIMLKKGHSHVYYILTLDIYSEIFFYNFNVMMFLTILRFRTIKYTVIGNICNYKEIYSLEILVCSCIMYSYIKQSFNCTPNYVLDDSEYLQLQIENESKRVQNFVSTNICRYVFLPYLDNLCYNNIFEIFPNRRTSRKLIYKNLGNTLVKLPFKTNKRMGFNDAINRGVVRLKLPQQFSSHSPVASSQNCKLLSSTIQKIHRYFKNKKFLIHDLRKKFSSNYRPSSLELTQILENLYEKNILGKIKKNIRMEKRTFYYLENSKRSFHK